jgi:hypothetical protein
VKELGVRGINCSLLAVDLEKVFAAYRLVAVSAKLPHTWPAALATTFNSNTPADVSINGQRGSGTCGFSFGAHFFKINILM